MTGHNLILSRLQTEDVFYIFQAFLQTCKFYKSEISYGHKV